MIYHFNHEAHTMTATTLPLSYPKRSSLTLTWVLLLLASPLPNILWQELTGLDTRWLFYAKLVLLAVAIAGSFLIPALRPLRSFLVVLLSIYAFEEFAGWLGRTTLWVGWFGTPDAPFTRSMLSTQLQRLLVSLLMIAVLLLMGYRRKQFFLTRGQLDAPIEPVRWLGFPNADPWTRFGGQFAIYISLGLLVFLVLAARPSADLIVQALPVLPAVLIFAALNAFNEEMTYRSGMLATLEGPVGSRQAILLAAAFFGIGHFYGVPYGVIGVILAGFLGWFLGKAMIETRGFFWAWFIHFIQDVLIFSFMAVGSIAAGGG
jgi:hypothetical protein